MVQVDKKRSSVENFAIMLDKVGSPKIADVAEFMRQSEAKKVDTLFSLFPCPELNEIDQEIEDAKADVSRIDGQIKGAESTIKRITDSKNQIEIPSGTIAAVQDEIKKVDAQIDDLNEQIRKAEIEDAKAQAVEQEKREEAERKEAEKQVDEIPMKTEQDWKDAGIDHIPLSPEMQENEQLISGMEKQADDFKAGFVDAELSDREFFQSPGQRNNIIQSIQRIIDAMKETGCGACAALIVAKQELKKYV